MKIYLMVVAAALIGLIACVGTELDVELEGPAKVGSARLRIKGPPGTAELLELPAPIESVDVTFVDGEGNPMTPVVLGVTPGSVFSIPAGAKWGIVTGPSQAPQPDDDSPGPGSLANTGSFQKEGFPELYFAMSFPTEGLVNTGDPNWTLASNKFITMHVDSPNRQWTVAEISRKMLRLVLAADPMTIKLGKWDVDSFHLLEPVTVLGTMIGANVISYDNVLQSEWPLYTVIVNGNTVAGVTVTEDSGWTRRESYTAGTLSSYPVFNQITITTQDAEDPQPKDWSLSGTSN